MKPSSFDSMAPPLLVAFVVLLLPCTTTTTAAQSPTTSDPFALGPAKTTHLHFFFHENFSSPIPSVYNITVSPITHDLNGFGTVFMIDDALTEGYDSSSRTVGRAQGLYALTTQAGEEFALLMTMNLVFLQGEFNGSSLAIVGRNNVLSSVREMPVVGGSGKFRMARGYALARTRMFNTSNGVIVEYDVYVQHYGSGGGEVAGKGSVVAGANQEMTAGSV